MPSSLYTPATQSMPLTVENLLLASGGKQPTTTPATQSTSQLGNSSFTGGTGGTVGTGGSASSGFPTTPNLTTYNPVLETVKPEETVQGQLNQILDPNSPLMRRAKAAALSNMASRGLLNSSLTDTAVVSAMVDRGLPIAQADAQTYFNQKLKNQDYQNQAALTNSNWANEFAKNAYVTQLDFWKQSNIINQQHANSLETMQYENQLKSDLLRLEYGLKKDLQQAQLDADVKNTYLSTYKDLLNQLNAILVDPNTNDASKRAMVNNYIKAIQKMRDSLRAIGQNVPDFDFSDYYVNVGSASAGNATKLPPPASYFPPIGKTPEG